MASIRERNGKFNVIYSYTNEKGERKQKWETYETKAEAKRRKKEIEYKKEMGSFVVRKCKTLDELITEYVALYGKENWALSTYEGNVSLINNYILPIIGDTKLSEINTRFIERYYQSLLKRRAVINPLNKTSRNEFVSSSTVRDINKLLRNCFEQAVKWELMEKNPCTHATVPKHKSQKRDIWTDTITSSLADIHSSVKLEAIRLMDSVVPRVKIISFEERAFKKCCTVLRASSCASVAAWLKKCTPRWILAFTL